MSDDRKKTSGKRPPGGRDPGGRGPGGRGQGGGKPKFGKPAAAKGDRPSQGRAERTPRGAVAGEARAPRRDEAASGADAPRKAYKPREDRGESRPEGRTFRKSSPGERPFASKAADRPPRKPDGDRPFRKPVEKGEKREFRPRREDSAAAPLDAPKRTYRPLAEGDRPFRTPEGERPVRKRSDGDSPRPGGSPRRHEGRPLRDEAAPEPGERIAKRLARAGISSRRDAEEMIAAGRVRVNGKALASPAVNVGPGDVIHVDNELIPAIERTRLFLFHKPGGVVTTNRDPEGRRTVFDVLPEGLPRLVTVGRLDINTEGLLLLTNDGGLARMLELPATGWLRRYRVRVHGRVDEKALAGLKDGIAVDGVFYGAIEAALDREQGSNAWLTIGLREGKNREVKNVLGALGLDVSRLIRVSYGPFQLGDLAEGAVQEIKGKALRDQLGERMIEESGANFDAPVVNTFSNRPVVRSGDRAAEPLAPRGERRAEPGEGGLIKNRKRSRDAHREDVLGRLGTKPDRPRVDGKRGGKPFDKSAGRSEKPFEPPKSRSANVWMAPGARPQGKKGEPSPSTGSGEKREGRFRSSPPRSPGPGKPRKGG